jgi:type I restriction enzyme S subunit
MRFGLEEHIIQALNEVFESNPKVDKAILFGSRAKGNFRLDSDIDIAIKGFEIHLNDLLDLGIGFEDRKIPQKVDLINYTTISEPALTDHIYRVGIEIYSRWNLKRLGDFIEVTNGYAFKSEDFSSYGIPVIKIKNVASGKLAMDDMQYYPFEIDDKLKRFVLRNGDILIAMTGSHIEQPASMVGRVCKYNCKEISLLNQRVGKIQSKDNQNLDNKFLYYFLRQDGVAYELANSAGGSANQANISPDQIKSLSLLLPTISDQKAIAEVLSSLDDKIDLLHRQNKTLEQMAETLFRQWFVEEAEEGWEVGNLENEFDFIMGQSPTGDTLNEDKNGMIFYQGRSDFGFRFPEPRVYTTSPTRIAKPLDTLVSVRAPVGDINMALYECCLGRGVAAFRYKSNSEFYSYTYYKMRSLSAKIKQFEDSGTVFGSIGKDDFKKLECVLPPPDLIEKFQSETIPLDNKIKSNTQQIGILTHLRDALLPKLMSGEVRVKA